MVRVPVLSEQITVVHPKVSTDGSLRTMAFSSAIRRVPRARQVVMTAGSPSGMAATARATATCRETDPMGEKRRVSDFSAQCANQ